MKRREVGRNNGSTSGSLVDKVFVAEISSFPRNCCGQHPCLCNKDSGKAGDLENEFTVSNLQLSQNQKKIDEVAAADRGTTALEDEAFNIWYIASYCNGDKLVRATELARLLTLEKS